MVSKWFWRVFQYADVIRFYHATACNATHGITVAILSVRSSVRRSARRVHCDKTKWWNADILVPHEPTTTLFSDTNIHWWAMPPSLSNIHRKWPSPFEKRRLRQISAHNVSTATYSEKSSITTNIKSTMGFTKSYRWSAYVTPKSHKVWLTERFFVVVFWVKVNFNRMMSATKFCCVNTSRSKL